MPTRRTAAPTTPMSAELVLTVRRGQAEPPAIGMGPGQVVGPLAFGARATWTIAAPGALPEHGFLYFDGTTLFVRSVDRALPLRIDDRSIPADWTPIAAPARLTFGGAELRLEARAAETSAVDSFAAPEPSVDETGRYPLPGREPPAKPAIERGAAPARSAREPQRQPERSSLASVPDLSARKSKATIEDEVTRLGSVDEIVQRARAARAASQNSPDSSGSSHAPASVSHPSLSPSGVGNAGTSQASLGRDAGSELSAPRNAPLFGPPPAAIAAGIAAGGAQSNGQSNAESNGPNNAQSRAPGNAIGNASAGTPTTGSSTAPSAKPPTGIGAKWAAASGPTKATLLLMPLMAASVWIIFFYEKPLPSDDRPEPAASASAAPSASAPTAASASDLPSPVEPSPVGPSPVGPSSAAAASSVAPSPTDPGPAPRPSAPAERTLERKAADAAASGDWAAAASLYEQLSKANPDSVAFREATRILRGKASPRK